MTFLYRTFFYYPIYNVLILIAALVPNHDVGFSVIVLTVLVKLVTLPLFDRSVRAQQQLKVLEPHIQSIKERHKDPQEQGAKILELYREHGVNPFSSIALLFIQIPIIYALFFVVQEITIRPADLYAFIVPPSSLETMFLGSIDVTTPNFLLAIIAGVTQFIQARLATPPPQAQVTTSEPSFQADFAKSMQLQTLYIFPVLIVFIGMKLPAAVALYWITNSLLTAAHEYSVRRKALALTR
jgi:YidC/Oxa1 family membrane protein insertase